MLQHYSEWTPLMTEKAKVKSLTFHFSLSRKYLADVFSLVGISANLVFRERCGCTLYMYGPVLWCHLGLIIYVGETCINCKKILNSCTSLNCRQLSYVILKLVCTGRSVQVKSKATVISHRTVGSQSYPFSFKIPPLNISHLCSQTGKCEKLVL